ncbi:tail fiber domain-containing protein, partial [Flavobacteriaceae bacterium]|nr:tail fiber domain-containing protein [Flavobacteriaceae bacterium]
NSSGSSVTSSATEFDTANTAFVIGNGTGSSSKSDAFKVLFNGNTTATGSVTATSFIGDGSQLSGIGILSAVTENNQTGARLSISNASNHGNIGSEALDLSYSNSASTTLGATGAGSIAMGLSTTASGAGSIAMGLSTVSSADATLAMGNNTTASGDGATAMGFGTVASGSYSSAIGRRTTASDFGSLVIGQHNSSGSSVTNSATAFNTANTAFVIGNGENDSSKSDAFKVLFNGNTTATGSVTATSFIGDGSQLSNLPSASIAFTDLTSTPTTIDGYGITDAGTGILSPVTENSNTGARLSTSNASNHGNIGSNAVDLSYTASASTTKGATGNYSIAMGRTTTASGASSTAIGNSTTASGASSTAIGNSTTASAFNSTAIGNSTTASGSTSIAMGSNSTASGTNSAAMGSNSTASDYGSLVIGQYNSSGSSVTNSATAFNTANTAFVIGNGTNGSNQSDAFKVLFSGETTIGSDLEVKGNVLVSSDARLKANIVSLGSTLAKLLLIDGKRYTMKKDGKQNIGVLAQDIQKVFPELVSTDDRDMLAVNYQGLVPVLINGLKEQDAKMKEQDAKMKEQDAKMKEQQKRLERLEAIISDK